ncbi:protein of unknown function [Streptomyces sp. KY75]|nr:protein of unknown function [Streptomyces sp. KY75]CAD5979673.1 protein of unknown function [Streptomyces sp. KY70]
MARGASGLRWEALRPSPGTSGTARRRPIFASRRFAQSDRDSSSIVLLSSFRRLLAQQSSVPLSVIGGFWPCGEPGVPLGSGKGWLRHASVCQESSYPRSALWVMLVGAVADALMATIPQRKSLRTCSCAAGTRPGTRRWTRQVPSSVLSPCA